MYFLERVEAAVRDLKTPRLQHPRAALLSRHGQARTSVVLHHMVEGVDGFSVVLVHHAVRPSPTDLESDARRE